MAGVRKPVRYGSAIGLKREAVESYLQLCEAVWPEVLETLQRCHLRNYSIYLAEMDDGSPCLFRYFEYDGDDFKADMARLKADPKVQQWWTQTVPFQVPLQNRKPDEHWMGLREVFHAG